MKVFETFLLSAFVTYWAKIKVAINASNSSNKSAGEFQCHRDLSVVWVWGQNIGPLYACML
jgi:hypothetical protein